MQQPEKAGQGNSAKKLPRGIITDSHGKTLISAILLNICRDVVSKLVAGADNEPTECTGFSANTSLCFQPETRRTSHSHSLPLLPPALFLSLTHHRFRAPAGVVYYCPCYSSPSRTSKNHIFDLPIVTENPQVRFFLNSRVRSSLLIQLLCQHSCLRRRQRAREREGGGGGEGLSSWQNHSHNKLLKYKIVRGER